MAVQAFADESQEPFVHDYDENEALNRPQKRSRSFHEDGTSPQFAFARVDAGGKKSKFNNFMDKLKMSTSQGKQEKKGTNNTIRLKRTVRFEELAPAAEQAPLKESNVIHKAKSILQQSMRKEDPTTMRRELSDHLDTRASNPIHVNNLRSLFGIERSGNPGEYVPQKRDDQELEIIHSVKSGSIPQASGDDEDQIQQRELADNSQIRRFGDFDDQNGQNITQKSAFSNNLFHLQKKNTSELNLLPSIAGESNAARQDHNESFNTAKEEVEDSSVVYKKDASMGDLNQMTFSKKQKSKSSREVDAVPMGRAHSEVEPDESTPSHARRRLQDMIDEDLLEESNGAKSGSSQDLNPYIQQRSQSMFIQNDSNMDDLIDYNSAHLQSKKAARRKNSSSKKRKN